MQKIIILFTTFLISSCIDIGKNDIVTEKQEENINYDSIRTEQIKSVYTNALLTVEYDSCEYIIYRYGKLAVPRTFVHKGNCKYCINRNNQIKRL